MRLIQVIRELLSGLDPAQVTQFLNLLKLLFGGAKPSFSRGPKGAKAKSKSKDDEDDEDEEADEAPTPAEKEQLKDELIAKGCQPEDANAIAENL